MRKTVNDVKPNYVKLAGALAPFAPFGVASPATAGERWMCITLEVLQAIVVGHDGVEKPGA